MRRLLVIVLVILSLPCMARKKKVQAVQPQRTALTAAESRRLSYFFLEACKQKRAANYSAAYDLFQYCLNIDPRSPEALYEMGLMKYYLREDSVGLSMLRLASEIDASNSQYMETLAAAYLDKDDFDNATPVLERLSEIETQRTDILYQLATIYKSKGDGQAAISALDRIETLEGRSIQTSMQKYVIYMALKKRKQALAELASLEKENPYDLRIPIIIGKQYLENDEEQRALECYDRVRESDPDNTDLQVAMLDYYKYKGQMEYRDFLRDSLIYAPGTSHELRMALVSDLMDELNGKPELSLQMQSTLDSLVKIAPTSESYSLRAAYMMYNVQDADSVASALRDLLSVDPSNRLALSNLLPLYLSKMDFEKSIEICRMGINSDPDNLSYHYYLGVSLYQQDRLDEAIDAFEIGVRQINESSAPRLVSELYAVLGDSYHEKGRADDSYAAYDSCLVYNPDNVACLNNYAYYLSLQGQQLEKAEEMAYRAIKNEPLNRTYLDTYAWVLFKRENYTMAKFYIDRVVPVKATD